MSRNTAAFPPATNHHSQDFLDYKAVVDLNLTTAPMKAIVEILINGPEDVKGPAIVSVQRPEEFLGKGDDTERSLITPAAHVMVEQQWVYTVDQVYTRQIMKGVAGSWLKLV